MADKGAPDFKITRQGMILGYVETKPLGENLDKVLRSEQIAKYKGLSQNIVLTDYLHFIWINKDGLQRESLCHATDLENPKFRPREDRAAAVAKLLEAFFSTAPEGIGRARPLALALATRGKLLRDYLGEELVRQERVHKEGRQLGLFQIFRYGCKTAPRHSKKFYGGNSGPKSIPGTVSPSGKRRSDADGWIWPIEWVRRVAKGSRIQA